MAYLSDRRKVELLLIVDQLAHIVRTGAGNAEEEEAVRCLDLLAQTRADLTDGQPDASRVLPRLVRIDRDHFAPMRKFGQPVAAFGLVIYVILDRLTKDDYLVVPDSGPFREALDILLPALEPFAQEPGRFEEATIRAEWLLHRLQVEGLFHDRNREVRPLLEDRRTSGESA